MIQCAIAGARMAQLLGTIGHSQAYGLEYRLVMALNGISLAGMGGDDSWRLFKIADTAYIAVDVFSVSFILV